jgi:cytochrome c6
MRRKLLAVPVTGALILAGALAWTTGLRAQTDASKVFTTNCAICHGADGSGSTTTGKALHAKDLRSAEVQNRPDAELTEIITKGKGKMPAFGAKLKTEGVKEMVGYVRELAKKK